MNEEAYQAAVAMCEVNAYTYFTKGAGSNLIFSFCVFLSVCFCKRSP